jgi:hypothetical protein
MFSQNANNEKIVFGLFLVFEVVDKRAIGYVCTMKTINKGNMRNNKVCKEIKKKAKALMNIKI